MKKFKNYTFWISLLGAIILLINTLGTTFGFSVDEVAITSVVTAVLGIFVTLGIIKKDKKTDETENVNDKTNDETNLEQSNEGENQQHTNQDDKDQK